MNFRRGQKNRLVSNLKSWMQGHWQSNLLMPISSGLHRAKHAGSVRFFESLMKGVAPDANVVFEPWLKLANECDDAPVFPVEEFHDDILRNIELLGDHSIFDEIISKLRPVMGKRCGAAAIADSHFRRAEQFVEKNHRLKAIRELHSARINWFSDETLGHSAFCCRLLAQCYSELGLHYAGLYYALSAGFITANALNDKLNVRTPECIFQAADSAYQQGHVCLYWELVGIALSLHNRFATNPQDVKAHNDFRRCIQNLPLVLFATDKFSPARRERMLADLQRWGLHKLVEDLYSDASKLFGKWSSGQFREALGNTFCGPPFSDSGKTCFAMWAAYGLRFCARWENSYDALRVAGEFVALFQIALTELSGCELDTVPGTVIFDIKLTDHSALSVQRIPTNEFYHWEIMVPKSPPAGTTGLNEVLAEMVSAFFQVLRGISVMPEDDFFKRMKEDWVPHTYDHGFFARRFPDLIDFFLPRGRYGVVGRTEIQCEFAAEDWHLKEPSELGWCSSLHPRFNETDELSHS